MSSETQSLESRLRRVEDILEINQLISAYGPAADSANLDALDPMWDPNCVYDMGATRFEGIDQLRKGIADFGASVGKTGSAHLASAPYVAIDGDHASATHYTTLITHAEGKFVLLRVSASRWELRRTNGRWVVTSRVNRALNGDADARKLFSDLERASLSTSL